MLSGSLRPVPRDQFGDIAVTISTPQPLNPDPGTYGLHWQLGLLPTTMSQGEPWPRGVTTAMANPRETFPASMSLGNPTPLGEDGGPGFLGCEASCVVGSVRNLGGLVFECRLFHSSSRRWS